MKTKKNKHADIEQPVGMLVRVKDFLPPPDELMLAHRRLKVTLSVDGDTLNFFKDIAEKNHSKYQAMMREVLKLYAAQFRDHG